MLPIVNKTKWNDTYLKDSQRFSFFTDWSFASQARAYPNEAAFKKFSLELVAGLTHKHSTRMESPAKEKHFSLL
jgi:hypothetical protein